MTAIRVKKRVTYIGFLLSADFLVPVLLDLREGFKDELLDLVEFNLVHVEARAMRVVVF